MNSETILLVIVTIIFSITVVILIIRQKAEVIRMRNGLMLTHASSLNDLTLDHIKELNEKECEFKDVLNYRDKLLEEAVIHTRETTSRQQRSTIKGKIGEQIAPLLPEFTKLYEPGDARFLGSPHDFVIYRGMSKGRIEEVIFVEVKTGRPELTLIEESLKQTIENGKVKFNILNLDINTY